VSAVLVASGQVVNSGESGSLADRPECLATCSRADCGRAKDVLGSKVAYHEGAGDRGGDSGVGWPWRDLGIHTVG
jgi:hypothetical protein